MKPCGIRTRITWHILTVTADFLHAKSLANSAIAGMHTEG